jgi:hypothetical protein
MTAKEKVLEVAQSWSEHDAEIALRAVEREHEDPVIVAFREAPEDDEPWTAADEAAMAEVRVDRTAGIPDVPLEQVMRELGDA